MEARASPDDPSSVVGPILIGNTLSWALWGLITAQVIAARVARPRGRTSRHGKNASAASSSADSSALARVGFGLRSRGARRKDPNSAAGPDTGVSGFSGKVRKIKGHWAAATAAGNEGPDDAFARKDVNPWTIAFTPHDDGAVGAYPRLPPPAPPLASGMRGRLSHVISFYQHGHRQAQNSTGTTTQTGTTT